MDLKYIKDIQTAILKRYKKYGRKLPWRQTRDLYAIHVSEVMLQQTQAERVIPLFLQWMKDFPDYRSLALASKSDLLKHWSGLGFNSRAIRLWEAAKLIEGSDDSFWKSRTKLMSLPGVGPYTSAAIMSFVWNQRVPVIDTNIRRVLIFLFKLSEKITPLELEKFAEKIIPKGKSREWHNALMDYGALELTARKTKIASLSKQSKFEGSNRQVRGALLKQLVRNGKYKVQSLEGDFPRKDVRGIVSEMVKEKLIVIKKGIITIAE